MPGKNNIDPPSLVIRARSFVYAAGGIALIASNTLQSVNLHKQTYEQHQAGYVAGTLQSAQSMEQLIDRVEHEAEALAGAISDGSLATQDDEQALAKMLQQDAMFYGGTIAFAPYEFSADRRLYAPYYSKKDGALEFMYIERSYDYTNAEESWYVDAMASGSRWSKPYFDDSVGDILMTTYSAVVYRNTPEGQRQATAVVTIDIAIQAIGDAVKRFGLGSNGYAEIVTDNGIYLYSFRSNPGY